MRKIIVFCATLFVALSNSFAISGFTKGDEIPIPLESHVDEVDTTIFRGPVIPIYAAFDPVQSIICRGRARGTTCSAQIGTGRGGQMGTARSAQ